MVPEAILDHLSRFGNTSLQLSLVHNMSQVPAMRRGTLSQCLFWLRRSLSQGIGIVSNLSDNRAITCEFPRAFKQPNYALRQSVALCYGHL